MDKWQALNKKFMISLYPQRGLSFVRGEGVHLFDSDGQSYLDMMSSYGASVLGHNHPGLTETVRQQAASLIALHGSFANDQRSQAAQMLCQRAFGQQPAQVYWSNSGTEAVEAALKFAVIISRKNRFIAFRNCYHGKTLGALSATDGQKYREPFEPLLWKFNHLPYGDARIFESLNPHDVGAVILEPIQGESGIIEPPAGFLAAVKKFCQKHNLLLIIDEIQTGSGRTGTFLAAEPEGVQADILCLGKGLAGGVPIGATLVRGDIATLIPRGIHTSTFGGSPLACAAAVQVLNELTPERLQHIQTLGKTFKDELQKLDHPLILGVRGRGFMLGIAVKDQRDQILKELQKEKILAIPAGPDVVRFLPPYIIEPAHVEQTTAALKKILANMRENPAV